jgi:hypothetical protein
MILPVLDLIQILGLTGCFPELASLVFGLCCSHPLGQLVLVVSLSGPHAVCVSHLMSGQLKSPVNTMFVMLCHRENKNTLRN